MAQKADNTYFLALYRNISPNPSSSVSIRLLALWFQMGLAKGDSWQESRGREESDVRVFSFLAPPVLSCCELVKHWIEGHSTSGAALSMELSFWILEQSLPSSLRPESDTSPLLFWGHRVTPS